MSSSSLQLVNYIDCTPADFPPVGSVLPSPGPLVLCLGRVVDVADPADQLRVKTNFPWTGDDQKSGIWSLVPQSFAGEVDDRHAGSGDLPAAGDWVVALTDPSGFEPPCVLGSVYPGKKRSRSAERPVPGRERVLFRTASGVEFLVTESAGGKPVSVSLAIRAPDGAYACRLTLEGDGSVRTRGKKLVFEGSSVIVNGDTHVNGPLRVRKGKS
jgi:hypothetical protein